MAATPSESIDAFIASLGDWRGETIARLRRVVGEAEPRLKEDFKWGVPVWVGRSNVVALGTVKDGVKINFFKGAALTDEDGIFNSGFDAKASRTIDLKQGDRLDEAAFARMVRSAAALDAGAR